MSLLSTKDLSRHFGGLKAVESVDFDLPAGQAVSYTHLTLPTT